MKRTEVANFDYYAEVRTCNNSDDVMGKNGHVQELLKDVLENILEGVNRQIHKFIKVRAKFPTIQIISLDK